MALIAKDRTDDGQVEGCAHLCQDAGIHAVGLVQDAGGTGELTSLTRIDTR